MKKILFLLLISQLNNAQELIFSQLPKDQYNFFNMVSAINDNDKGIFVADDFVFQKDSKIRKIKIFANVDDGFFDSQNLFIWTGSIYFDDKDQPSDIPTSGKGRIFPLFKFPLNSSVVVTKDIANPNVVSIEFNISDSELSFTFKANEKYWLTIYPTVKTNANFFAQKNFYWAASTSNLPNLSEAKIADPNNFLGQSFTNWTNVSSAVNGVSGMAFQLYGETLLSTKESALADKVKVFPNPTSDKIKVDALDMKELILYTMDGKEVKRSKEKEINLYAEPKGIYLLKIIKMNGDYSIQKIIKK